MQARRLLRRLSPDAVVGFGGYASIPTMLAAIRLGVPTAIHEQNAVLGRANRLLAGRVSHIATGFAATAGLRAADKTRAVHTGNPVRPAVLAVAGAEYRPPQSGEPVELLITGGSQGARIFADIVPAALAALPPTLRGALRVSQQARPEDCERVTAQLKEAGIAAEISSFFTDIPARLARAHLVICRSGASTIAELAAVGSPGAAGSLSARDRRSPDRERPRFRRFRRGLGHSAAGIHRGEADRDAQRAARRPGRSARGRGAGAPFRPGRRGRPAGGAGAGVGGESRAPPAWSAPHEIAAGFDRADPFCRDRRYRDERHRRGAAQSRLSGAGQRLGRGRQYAPADRARHPGQDRPRRGQISMRPRSS